MPFTNEPSGTLGSKDLLYNPDVVRALQHFQPGTPPLERHRVEQHLRALTTPAWTSSTLPWSYVFAIDGSNYETEVLEEDQRQVGYVKVGGVLTPLQDLFDLQRRPSVGPLDLEMLKQQRITAAVVLPGQHVAWEDESSVALSFRQALHTFMLSEQPALPGPLGNRSFYDVLAEVLRHDSRPSWRKPKDDPLLLTCPVCHERHRLTDRALHGPTWEQAAQCRCGEPLLLVDTLRFHNSVLEHGSNRNLLNDVMLTLEKLLALHWVQVGMESSVLVLLDGPLALYGDRQGLVPGMTAWLAAMNREASPVPGNGLMGLVGTPGLMGVSKHGQLAAHAQRLHQRFPDLAAGVYPMTMGYMSEMVALKTGARPQTFEDRDRSSMGAAHLVKTAQDRWYVVDTPVWSASVKDAAFHGSPDVLFQADQGRYWSALKVAIDRFDGPRYGGSLLPMTFAHELVSIARDPCGVVLTQHFQDAMRANRPVTVVVPDEIGALQDVFDEAPRVPGRRGGQPLQRT